MENATRMTDLVNDMLNISRMENSKIEFKIEKINIVSEIKNIVRNFKIKTDEKGLNLKFVYKKPNILGFTDKSKLNEIVTNLLGNSLKFTEKGEITVLVLDDQQNILIKIVDTGTGVSKKIKKDYLKNLKDQIVLTKQWPKVGEPGLDYILLNNMLKRCVEILAWSLLEQVREVHFGLLFPNITLKISDLKFNFIYIQNKPKIKCLKLN